MCGDEGGGFLPETVGGSPAMVMVMASRIGKVHSVKPDAGRVQAHRRKPARVGKKGFTGVLRVKIGGEGDGSKSRMKEEGRVNAEGKGRLFSDQAGSTRWARTGGTSSGTQGTSFLPTLRLYLPPRGSKLKWKAARPGRTGTAAQCSGCYGKTTERHTMEQNRQRGEEVRLGAVKEGNKAIRFSRL